MLSLKSRSSDMYITWDPMITELSKQNPVLLYFPTQQSYCQKKHKLTCHYPSSTPYLCTSQPDHMLTSMHKSPPHTKVISRWNTIFQPITSIHTIFDHIMSRHTISDPTTIIHSIFDPTTIIHSIFDPTTIIHSIFDPTTIIHSIFDPTTIIHSIFDPINHAHHL